jgi:hypothetical protein
MKKASTLITGYIYNAFSGAYRLKCYVLVSSVFYLQVFPLLNVIQKNFHCLKENKFGVRLDGSSKQMP